MFLLKRWTPLGLACLCACGLFQGLRPPGNDSTGKIQVEAGRTQYDGEVLQFRLLLGATDGGVVVDRRLIENVHVAMDAVRECAMAGDLSFLFVDRWASPPTEKDLLLVEPGYWFGSDLRYPLFPREDFPDGGPRCIDAYFSVRPEPWKHENWKVPLIVRAERAIPDGGIEIPPDAGHPADAGF